MTYRGDRFANLVLHMPIVVKHDYELMISTIGSNLKWKCKIGLQFNLPLVSWMLGIFFSLNLFLKKKEEKLLKLF